MKRIDQILTRIYDTVGIQKDVEFCELFKIKPNTLSTWKKRDTIPYELLEEISQNENKSLDYLLFGKEIGSQNVQTTIKDNQTISIPVYADVYASAGDGALNSEVISSHIELSKEFLKSMFGVVSVLNLSIINVRGDSMEPTLPAGAKVLVQNNSVSDGQICVVRIEDELYVKRLQKLPHAKLISDNAKYDDIVHDGLEYEVVGVVVGFFKKSW